MQPGMKHPSFMWQRILFIFSKNQITSRYSGTPGSGQYLFMFSGGVH